MKQDKFVLGIDYGRESGRVVVVRVDDGELLSSFIVPYTDGVIDSRPPGGVKLERDWALQNPGDYLLVVEKGVPKALKSAGVKAEQVIGLERKEEFIRIYGGRCSSEWFFSKLLQIANEAPKIYDATDRSVEAADWIVWQLTGEEKRNTYTVGYKALWVKGRGFPSPDFFGALHPAMKNVIGTKVPEDYYPLGARACGLAAAWAKKTY